MKNNLLPIIRLITFKGLWTQREVIEKLPPHKLIVALSSPDRIEPQMKLQFVLLLSSLQKIYFPYSKATNALKQLPLTRQILVGEKLDLKIAVSQYNHTGKSSMSR